jgi:predicted metal-dependent hydrolase
MRYKVVSSKEYLYKLNGKEYEVLVIYKTNKKNITYRYKDEKFVISAPPFYSYKNIERGLVKFAPRLMKKNEKPQPYFEDKVYLFGSLYGLGVRQIIFPNGMRLIFKDKIDFEKKIRNLFLSVVTRLIRANEEKMNIKNRYNVKVRKMKTRYGTNSRRTKTITIGLELVHYSIEIINSIIIHELAHILVFDHSKRFYDIVYRYCPDYDNLHKALKKGKFDYGK